LEIEKFTSWVRLGDENTAFFQAMAAHSYTKKFITSLALPGDILVTGHEQKANILSEAFKNRMGVSKSIGISYNPETLL